MEESTTPDALYGDPCDYYGHLYDHFATRDQDSTSSKTTPSPSESSASTSKRPSMLVTGFGLRNLESLQRALLDDEQRRQMLLAQYDKNEEFECSSISSASISLLETKTSSTSTRIKTSEASKSLSLEYLMGIVEAAVEEEALERKPPAPKTAAMEGQVEDEVLRKMTLAMRKARKYLRDHHIFAFFRFIIAHMLSELPENPIQFIMDLLDRCLLYRAGFGQPPLLFEKPHIEQLFHLMDRMRTGFVDMEQYETGMKTLGICSYDRRPPLSTEGLVAQEFFVEEAYECLTDLLVEMIRSHRESATPPSLVTPPPTEVDTATFDRLSA